MYTLLFNYGFVLVMASCLFMKQPTPDQVTATCDVEANAGPDTSLCPPGEEIQLMGSFIGNGVAWEWQPQAGLNDPFSLTPVATVTGDITYTLTVFGTDPTAINLVVNGDFESGNTAFVSDYNYVVDIPGSQSEMFPEGTYAVIPNPNLVHTGFAACTDHSGGGNMMVVNGAANFQNIWCQTVSVTANTFYNFSAWVTSVNPSSPAQLQFSINGTPIGMVHNASSSLCTWESFNALWGSGGATTAEICILNLNTQAGGNDFAIDDIEFIELCQDSDEMTISLIQEIAPEPIIDGPSELCDGQIANYAVTIPGAPQILSYEWSIPNGMILSGQGTDSVEVQWSAEGMICLEISTICDANQTCFPVIVNQPPDYPDITGPSFLCFGESAIFQVNDDPNVDSLHWVIPAGMELIDGAGTTSIEVHWTSAVSQDLCVEAINDCGLTSVCFPIETEVNAPSTLDTIICEGSTFFFNGTEYGHNNLFGEELISSVNGCDSLVIVIVEEAQPDTTLVHISSCHPADTGIVSLLLPGAICDSLVITHTVLVSSDTVSIHLTSCNPADTGTTVENLVNVLGCDSVITTHVMYSPSDISWISSTSCNPADTGVVEQLLQNQFGCDSLVIATTLYSAPDTTMLEDWSCSSQDTGIFTQTLANNAGCDSTVITLTHLLHSDTTLVALNTCIAVDTGIVIEELLNAQGCDSIVFSLTTYVGSDTSFLQAESCNPADTGVTINSLENGYGCDSVIVLETELSPPATCVIEVEIAALQPLCHDDPGFLVIEPGQGLLPFSVQWLHVPSGDTGELTLIQFEADSIEIWADGLYQVTIGSANGLQQTESVTIQRPPPLSVEAVVLSGYGDYEISCAGASDGWVSLEVISPGTPPLSTQWSTGALEDQLFDLPVGQYSVSITDANGCVAVDSVTLNEPPPLQIQIEHRDVSCFGNMDGSIHLDNLAGGSPPYTLTLDGNIIEAQPPVQDLGPGIYTVMVTDQNGCTLASELSVSEPPALHIDMGKDTSIFIGEEVQLHAETSIPVISPAGLTWSPNVCSGCTSIVVAPKVTTQYIVQVMDTNGCLAIDTITVFVTDDREVFIPNVFSPNGDGANDFFYISGAAGVAEIASLTIFDRWGNQLFHNAHASPNVPDEGWDGSFRGKAMQPGVYVYRVVLVFRDGIRLARKGDITLIR